MRSSLTSWIWSALIRVRVEPMPRKPPRSALQIALLHRSDLAKLLAVAAVNGAANPLVAGREGPRFGSRVSTLRVSGFIGGTAWSTRLVGAVLPPHSGPSSSASLRPSGSLADELRWDRVSWRALGRSSSSGHNRTCCSS